jgi:hypothetical protein
MHYYKNEDVKTQEKFCEHTKTNVEITIYFIMFSSLMIRPRVRRIMIIARSANMRANGANTDKREKLQNKSSELLLQRIYLLLYLIYL